MKTASERFTTLARRPYKEVITVVLRAIDYHHTMMYKDPEHKYFHEKQATRLKEWMVDMKDFIHEKEQDG